MKRKNILGLPVFTDDGNNKIGLVKEIMLNKNDFKIDFYIVIGNTIDSSFILPFFNSTLNSDFVATKNAEDMMEIDSFVLYNEIKRSESIFVQKDVLDQDGNIIGKVSDYDFEEKSGVLTNINYFNDDRNETDSIAFADILDNTKESLTIHVESFKYENKDVHSATELDVVEQTGQDNYQIISRFIEELIEKRNEIELLFETMQNELVSEVDNTIKLIKSKRDTLLEETPHKNSDDDSYELPVEPQKTIKIIKPEQNEENNANSNNLASQKINEPSSDSNKELEKLYELQRKRMSILKKL